MNELLRKQGVRLPREVPILIYLDNLPHILSPVHYVVKAEFVPHVFREAVGNVFRELGKEFDEHPSTTATGSWWSIWIPAEKVIRKMREGLRY